MPAKLDPGHYGSPRWSAEILDCAMPMTFDTYSNCAHQCVYCFSFFQRALEQGSRADSYLNHRVRAVDVDRVKRMFLDPDTWGGQFAWYIKGRYVLQWGGLSDGFDWYERHFGKSLELLRFFCEIDYPISISTKGVWWLKDPRYTEILRGAKNVHLKISIITDNEQEARILEPGTPLPAARYEALKIARDLGLLTTMRFRPYIPVVGERAAPTIVRWAAETGCYSLTTEFLCLESRASNTARARYEQISKAVGFDVFQFYRRHSAIRSGLLRLNYEYKRPRIEALRTMCEEAGVKFFVSDAHHKEASEGTGCCGLPDDGPLSRINRGQYSEAMQIAKKNGLVRWSDISEAAAPLRNIPFFHAEGFNQGGSRARAVRAYQTMYDYMRDIWNRPDLGMSPARYFGGVLVPCGTDANGDIVYYYNQPLVEGRKRVASSAELRALMAKAKENIRADGAKYGHVAFPVYLYQWAPANLDVFNEVRLPVTLCVPPARVEEYHDKYTVYDVIGATSLEEVKAAAAAEGYEWYWIINGGNMRLGNRTIRAMLSELESKMVPGVYDWAELVGPAENSEQCQLNPSPIQTGSEPTPGSVAALTSS